MFKENNEHQQEKLFSPVKDLSGSINEKLQNHRSTHFYRHIFTQIEETKFGRLYHDGYSRPNKPVNELVSLEIIKHLLGLSDTLIIISRIFAGVGSLGIHTIDPTSNLVKVTISTDSVTRQIRLS